jgi:tetratricopeptide (TPR) repeat protein
MRTLAILLALVAAASAFGQSTRSLNNEGVDAYESENYADAEVNFRKGAELDPKLFEPSFNLGDAYYKQGKYEEAIRAYQEAAAKTQDKKRQAEAWYNVGNALLKSDKIKESVGAYSNALKLNPNDREAKYNLSLALNKLKQQRNQNKNDDKNKDKNKDDKKDKNKDQQNEDQQDKNEQKQDQQNQDQRNQDQENQGDQRKPQPRENELTKEEAERILEALKNNEKNLQEQLRKKHGSTRWIEKDW